MLHFERRKEIRCIIHRHDEEVSKQAPSQEEKVSLMKDLQTYTMHLFVTI